MLTDLGGIDPLRDLVADGVPDGTAEGALAYVSRDRWYLRPGQLVRVDIRRGRGGAGLYVPAIAIGTDLDGPYVLTLQDGPDGLASAKRIGVAVGASFGDFRVITAKGGAALEEGMRIVYDGAQFVKDGEKVNAYDQVEVSP